MRRTTLLAAATLTAALSYAHAQTTDTDGPASEPDAGRGVRQPRGHLHRRTIYGDKILSAHH